MSRLSKYGNLCYTTHMDYKAFYERHKNHSKDDLIKLLAIAEEFNRVYGEYITKTCVPCSHLEAMGQDHIRINDKYYLLNPTATLDKRDIH